jgi:nucleoside phosphorylase
MNSFGLAMACEQTRTPLLILKVISDYADHNAGENFKEFVSSYDGQGGRMARELIQSLPPSPSSPESYDKIRKIMK